MFRFLVIFYRLIVLLSTLLFYYIIVNKRPHLCYFLLLSDKIMTMG